MKAPAITPDNKSNVNSMHTLNSGGHPLDQNGTILEEEYFHQMLYLEKKRTERSGKPFLLMLLSIKDSCPSHERSELLKTVVSSLSSATRETDIKGWYERNHIMGVILTEIGATDVKLVKESVLHKVHQNLAYCLPSERCSNIAITFQYHPEQQVDKNRPSHSGFIHVAQQDMITFATPQTKTHLLSFLTQQRWFLLTGDVLVISLAHMLSAWIRLGERINVFQDYTGAYIFALALYPLALYVFDLYNMQRAFLLGQSALRMTAAVLLGGTLSTMCFYLVPEWQYGRGALAIQMVLMWIFLIGWRITYGTAFQAARAKKKALVLGAGESAKALYKLLATPLSPYEVTGFLDDDPGEQGTILGSPAILGTLEQFGDIARETGSKVAIVAIPHNRPYWLNRKILEARLQGMEVFEMPTVYERLTGRVPAHYIEDQWLLFSDGFYLLSKEYVQKIKRLSDFAVAGLLLLMTSPLILLTALAIRLESRGPVFYQQERVGKNSRVFKVYKFRSMRIDAESQGARWAQKGDPRVTLVGRWIRPFRIDELPQIWNIFTGDMSLVGPRPERPEFVKDLEYKIPYYGIRHSVRPGITGWAQVKYPYGASVEDALRKLEYDLYYIKNMSIVLDLKILLRTVGVVLLGEGAR